MIYFNDAYAWIICYKTNSGSSEVHIIGVERIWCGIITNA